MNKLFSKIATLSVGLAMAIGVGVAVGSRSAKVVRAATAEFTLSSASAAVVNGVTVSFAKGYGSSAPAWYAAGLRLYASNTVTVSSSDTLTGITFNWEKQGSKAFASVTANVGSYSHPSAAGDGVWTGSANEVVFTLGSSGQLQLNTLSAETGSSEDHGELVSLSISGAMTKTDYKSSDSSWSPAGFTVTAVYEDDYEQDVTSSVSWTYSPSVPAEGVTAVVATASFNELSAVSNAQEVTYTVTHEGTAADPFTVAEALAKCTEIGSVGNKGQGPWVTKGIISRVTSAPVADYWNATYYISDDGSQNNELQVYRGFYLDNAKFDATTALLLTAGKVVTVTGNLTGSYGSEYCQGNYLLALEEQDTGDVDVTFTPESTSVEIGASGTFTASSETSGAVFTWSVDNSSILTVNENTGVFEAVGLGVARVTVTATAGGKQGSTYADITVNGSTVMSVAQANTIAEALPSSGASSTTGYYIYVSGYVKEFATTTDANSNPTGFDIFDLNEEKSIVVYTGKAGYSDFIDGLSLGDYVVVKANVQNYSGKFELTNPAMVSSAKSCLSFVFEFKSYTEGEDGICTDYDGETSNKAAFEAIWKTLETSYDGLSGTEKTLLVTMAGCGDTLVNAMGLYDYVTGKYELDNFVDGRTPVVFPKGAYANLTLEGNPTIFIVVTIAAVSTLAFTMLLVFKKKKHN